MTRSHERGTGFSFHSWNEKPVPRLSPFMERVYLLDERRAYGVAFDNWWARLFGGTFEGLKQWVSVHGTPFSGSKVACRTAGGNASVYGWPLENPCKRVLVLADGAAFGAEATRVLMYQGDHPGRLTVCLPESFEWLFLASAVIKCDDICETAVHIPGANLGGLHRPHQRRSGCEAHFKGKYSLGMGPSADVRDVRDGYYSPVGHRESDAFAFGEPRETHFQQTSHRRTRFRWSARPAYGQLVNATRGS